MNPRDVSPWAIRGLYLFALVLMLSPVIDFLATVWPIRPGELAWRYGFFGLLAGFLQTPLLGLVVVLVVAAWEGNAGLLKGVGAGMVAVALLLVGCMGLFALDVMQVRAIRTEEVQEGVLVGAAMQEIKYGLIVLALGVLGLGAMKTSAALKARGSSSPGIVSSAG